MKILIIDNFDSFTFNLYQDIGDVVRRSSKIKAKETDIQVYRNNDISIADIKNKSFDRIIISPGPGTPEDHNYFGVCADVIVDLGRSVPILGVCLGMQGIAHCFGAKVVKAPIPMHGKTSNLIHDGNGIFNGVPQGINVMRYHSLMVDPNSLPDCITVTSVVSPTEGQNEDLVSLAKNEHEIMGIRHKTYNVEGIQFHPESFATEGSRNLLENFIFQNGK